MRFAAVLVVVLVSGCLTNSDGPEHDAAKPDLEPVWDTSGPYSRVLEDGPFNVMEMTRETITAHDGTDLAAALWRPDTDEPVPVILVISPYWGSGLYFENAWTREFFLPNFVEHGYAYAKVAVRGTSFSGGCMQSMGPDEQADMNDIVEWFGTQQWSSGSVGIIGLSYVGTTPWAAAQWGNPHLKTIVPMSGVTDWFELGFRNGTAEPRTPIHMALYWSEYGVANQADETLLGDDPMHLLDNVCTEPVMGVAASEYAVVTGGREPAPFDEYWAVRNYQERVAANYNGSIFLIHGLQDWNVNIDMAVPFVTDLQAAGFKVKWLLGQWDHTAPDRTRYDADMRWDFAQTLLDWFDSELKGAKRDTGPTVDVEDTHGAWRTEQTWPPADAAYAALALGDGVLAHNETDGGPATGSSIAVNPTGLVDPGECRTLGLPLPEHVPGTQWRFTLPAQDEDLRFAGPVRFHAVVTPLDPAGGQLYAELIEWRGDEPYRVAHGAMNLRYHAGGHEAQTVIPGQPITAKLEMFAQDVVIKAGNRLMLRVVPEAPLESCSGFENNNGALLQRPFLPGPSAFPLELHWGEDASRLLLPLIDRDAAALGDGRYPGQPRAGASTS